MPLRRHIPNAITCLNLFLGCVAVVFGLRGGLSMAVVLVMMAAVLDFCDGLAARLLKAYSPMGKELDSLADLISFGLAPAAMLYYVFSGTDTELWEPFSFFPFILVVAAGLRLAKFNTDNRQSEQFLGLPTPACALLTGSLLVYLQGTPQWTPLLHTLYFIPLLVVLLSWLMLSNLPMFSLKIKALKWKGNQIPLLFLGLSLVYISLALVFGWPWSLAVLLILLSYLVLSLFLWAFVPPAHLPRNQ